ncbi:ubiquinone anaerobic biosynthesis accessory factor UbiT [Ensifer adhaerens]|uniref:ubiquinone anaerobic biosynthesis accessory factor UbiT n=1 Tax=Ensifer adhaerens TaxID=106592 RepID=UPI000CF1354E|nr:SCP2 sterol-binding domain-containing protein [Ensifer adhaerens]
MPLPLAITAPLSFVPIIAIETVVRRVFARVIETHPGLFDRLADHAAKRYAFLPSDLPIGFLVEPAVPRISVHRKASAPASDALMEGELVLLLALLEGRIDGDAVFFSRDLTVSGDMEAMLALRNALDDCEIDLPRDLADMSGPLAPLVRRAAEQIRERALARVSKEEAPRWN